MFVNIQLEVLFMGQSFPFGKAILGIVGCFDLFK
jgi:hypothetical protein